MQRHGVGLARRLGESVDVAPARGIEHRGTRLGERPPAARTVHLGAGSHQDPAPVPRTRVEDRRRALHVAGPGADGIRRDDLRPDGGGQVVDDVGPGHGRFQGREVADVGGLEPNALGHVAALPRRQVVEDVDVGAAVAERLGQVTSEEAGTTGDERAHGTKLPQDGSTSPAYLCVDATERAPLPPSGLPGATICPWPGRPPSRGPSSPCSPCSSAAPPREPEMDPKPTPARAWCSTGPSTPSAPPRRNRSWRPRSG